MQIQGKMTALLIGCQIGQSAFYLTVVFQFHKYQVFLFIFLNNICKYAVANIG